MRIKFSHSELIAENIISYYFDAPAEFNYLAGQYAELSFPGEIDAQVDGNRWYTLSSSPSEKLLAITTKFNPKVSKFKNSLKNLKKGEELVISEPIGDFVLPIDKSIPLVYISGGIGITPVRSIVKYLIDTHQKRNISLIYYAKNNEQLIFDDLFNSYKINYRPIFSSEPKLDIHQTLKSINSSLEKSLFYVSGPQTMVETMAESLSKEYGQSRVVMDYFPGYLLI